MNQPDPVTLSTKIDTVEAGARRVLRGPIVVFFAAVAVMFSLFEVSALAIWVIDLWIFEAVALIFIFVLGLLSIPEGKWDRERITWWDMLVLLMGVAPSVYVILEIERLSRFYGVQWTTLDLVFTGTLIVALLVLIRRSFGWPFVIIVLGFLVYLFFGQHLPPDLFGHPGFRPARALSFLFGHEAIFGPIASVFVRIIFLFLLFGAFFQGAGASDFLVKISNAVAGRWRGGPAKVAVLASSLFGTISGNSVANVVTTGVFTIPMMKKIGFKPHFASAVEATASAGGQLMPPIMGSGAFLMAEFLGIPYREVVIAAVIPAILYYFCVLSQVDLEAVKNKLQGLPKEEIPSISQVLKEGGHLIIPILVLLYMLFIQGSSLTRAALLTILSVLAVSWFKKGTRMGPRRVLDALISGGKSVVTIGAICFGAGIIVGAINMTGLGVQFSSAMLRLAAGNFLLVLFFTAVACILLGLALPTTAAYIVASAVAAPALIKLGVLPLAAHLFVFYFAILSPISPPVGTTYYVAAGIGGASVNKTGWTAVRLAFAAFVVPFLFVYHPELIMQGSPLEIITAFTTAALALAIFATGVVGVFYFGGIKWYPWQRILLLGAAGGLLMPGWVTDLSGLAVVAVALLSHPQAMKLMWIKLGWGRRAKDPALGLNSSNAAQVDDSPETRSRNQKRG
ncbi:TRAP transporter permease [Chloroflexota bacterium]